MEGEGTRTMVDGDGAELVIVALRLVREEGDIEFLHNYYIWTGV
jgi:hypothetical protein